MKVSKARQIAVVSTALLLIAFSYVWFALGVYSDREFGGLYLFSKHRLSPRFFFYAPLGESDRDISSLTDSQRRAEEDFHEFVDTHGGYERGRHFQILQ